MGHVLQEHILWVKQQHVLFVVQDIIQIQQLHHVIIVQVEHIHQQVHQYVQIVEQVIIKIIYFDKINMNKRILWINKWINIK